MKKKYVAPELQETRRAKVRCFAGISKEATIIIFWACIIIPGVFVLNHVRKTDWARHWEEMEAEHKIVENREAIRRAAADEARKLKDDN